MALHTDYIFITMITMVLMMVQHRGDGGGPQCPLPHPGDSHHDALDAEGLHPHPAAAAQHEETSLRQGQTQVTSILTRLDI